MSDVNIDSISIEIEASSSKAVSSLRNLNNSIANLGNRVQKTTPLLNDFTATLKGLSGVSISSIEHLAKSLNELGSVKLSKTTTKNLKSLIVTMASSSAATLGIDGLSRSLNSLTNLKGLKISGTTATNLNQIISACKQSSNVSTEALTQIIEPLKSLSGIKLSSTIGVGLKKTVESLQTLNSLDIPTEKFTELRHALSELSGLDSKGFSGLVRSLHKMPEAFKNLNQIDFEKLEIDCKRLVSALGDMPEAMNKAGMGAAMLTSNADRLSPSLERASKSTREWNSTLKKVKRIGIGAAGVFTSVKTAMNLMNSAFDYVEGVNLYEQAMAGVSREAQTFYEVASQKLGIDPLEWMNAQGGFQAMALGMGMASDKATVLSQTLTQLGYDFASYWNLDTAEAMEKLRSGLSGEMEAVRRYGIDISDAHLKEMLLARGMDANTQALSQRQKMMLRYQAIMEQTTIMQSDMARTLNSPANVVRQFTVACTQAGRSITALFIPPMMAIIKVATQVARAVTLATQSIGNLIGGFSKKFKDAFVLPQPNFKDVGKSLGGSGIDDANDSVDNLSNALDGAGRAADDARKRVKELRNETLGFDELHIIDPTKAEDKQSPAQKLKGAGAGGYDGFDFDLPTYDMFDGLQDVQSNLQGMIDDIIDGIKGSFEDLLNTCSDIFGRIAKQIKAIDWRNLFVDNIVAAVNLLNVSLKSAIQILGELAIAFNVPATFAATIKLATSTLNVFSAVVESVSDAIVVFNRIAILPLVESLGQGLRLVISTTSKSFDYFTSVIKRNHDNIVELGRVAGIVIRPITLLVEAFAVTSLKAAAAVIETLIRGIANLTDVLVSTEIGRNALVGLGAALAAAFTAKALSEGIMAMAALIENFGTRAVLSMTKVHGVMTSGLSDSITDLKTSFNLLGEAGKSVATKFDKTSKSMYETAKSEDQVNKSSGMLATTQRLVHRANADINRSFRTMKASLREIIHSDNAMLTVNTQLKASFTHLKTVTSGWVETVRTARANNQTLGGTIKSLLVPMQMNVQAIMNNVRARAAEHGSIHGSIGAFLKEKAVIMANTTLKGAAAVASGVLTAAQVALNVAVNAFPGMIIITALQGILSLITPLVEKLWNGIKAWFGFGESSESATESMSEAEMEAQQVAKELEDLTHAVNDARGSNAEFDAMLKREGVTSEEFAQRLHAAGISASEFESQVDEANRNITNSYRKLETSQEISLDEMIENLNYNVAATRRHAELIALLMEKTGLDSSSALVREMQEGGTKYNSVLEEVLRDGSEERLQQLVDLHEEKSELAGQKVVDGIKEKTDDVADATGGLVNAAAEAITENDQTAAEAVSAAVDKSVETINQKAESFKTAGNTLGRQFMSGLSSGVSAQTSSVVKSANEVCTKISDVFNSNVQQAKLQAGAVKLMKGVSRGIEQSIRTIEHTTAKIPHAVSRTITTKSAMYVSAGRSVGESFARGIGSTTNRVSQVTRTLVNSVKRALDSTRSAAQSAGSNVGDSFASGISTRSTKVYNRATQLSRSAIDGLDRNISRASRIGREFSSNFINGIRYADAYYPGRHLSNDAIAGVSSNYNSSWNNGWWFGEGFVRGIYSKSNAAYWAAYTISRSAINGARVAANIHSPSREMRKIGQWFTEGMALGIGDNTDMVVKSSTDMMHAAMGSASRSFNREMGTIAPQLTARSSSSIQSTTRHEVDWSKLEDVITRTFTKAVEKVDGSMRVEMDGVLVGKAVHNAELRAGVIY